MASKNKTTKKTKTDYLNSVPEKTGAFNQKITESGVYSGWTSLNQNVYQGLENNDFFPAMYYTAQDASVGKTTKGYSESDETVAAKKKERQENTN